MPKTGAKDVKKQGKSKPEEPQTEDIFAGDLDSEFGELPQQLEPALGAVVRICVRSGGYFGLSVSDDGGSCKLTIRTGQLHADKRFYKLADLEAAISKVFSKLRESS